MNSVEVANLKQGYRNREILTDFSIHVSPGLTGLLGPNGAGKTTLLQTLATVTPPISGTVSINGEEIRSHADLRNARRNIGYLPQAFKYHPNFTVSEYVEYSLWLREATNGVAKSQEAIALVGLEHRRSEKMKKLSGGMLQRAGVAAAIAGHPAVIILDEPTVGLDPSQRLQFRGLLSSFSESAVILSTHLIEDIAAVCENVAVLIDGEIKFYGTSQEMAEKGSSGDLGNNAAERGYMNLIMAGDRKS